MLLDYNFSLDNSGTEYYINILGQGFVKLNINEVKNILNDEKLIIKSAIINYKIADNENVIFIIFDNKIKMFKYTKIINKVFSKYTYSNNEAETFIKILSTIEKKLHNIIIKIKEKTQAKCQYGKIENIEITNDSIKII